MILIQTCDSQWRRLSVCGALAWWELKCQLWDFIDLWLTGARMVSPFWLQPHFLNAAPLGCSAAWLQKMQSEAALVI